MSADFLDVACSLTGRRWRTRDADPALVREHQLRLGLSEPLARALAGRGVTSEAAPAFLRPRLKDSFPNPSSFADMDRAAAIIVDAVARHRPATIFADYDVDGAASAALLARWSRAMGSELPIYVPDRMTEGYGPSPAAFRRLREAGVELVITVDCGAAAHDAIAAAAEIGLELVVIDHHLMACAAHSAAALVNPNRPDCASGQGMLAAAGVTFVLLAALNREVRARGLFGERELPDLLALADLAALGAVCDVTCLVGFNRALAARGLVSMSAWVNPGLAALMDVAGANREEPASVFTAGFILGPRINAGGRIGRSDLGARLLATDNLEEAAELARELDALNSERRQVEQAICVEAARLIDHDSNLDPAAPVIVVAADGWHPGVIGIVAGRLRERYRKPTVVIGLDRASDIGRGSGRSQSGVNLGAAVCEAFDRGLLLSGGGHAMAAGLTVRPAAIPELRAFLCERLAAESETAGAVDALEVDALVGVAGASTALLNEFAALAPFGPGNPEPCIALADVRCERASVVGAGHVRCNLAGPSGNPLKAIAWRCADTALGKRILAEGGAAHIAGRLRADNWNGRQGVQLEIEDMADPRRQAAG
jgi:single-stranded-DNA-specific exonuclease